jgi:hypothetical protein
MLMGEGYDESTDVYAFAISQSLQVSTYVIDTSQIYGKCSPTLNFSMIQIFNMLKILTRSVMPW